MNFREVLRSIRVGSNVLRRIVPCCPRSVSAGLAGLHPVGRVQQLSPRHSREREEILRRFRAFLPLSFLTSRRRRCSSSSGSARPSGTCSRAWSAGSSTASIGRISRSPSRSAISSACHYSPFSSRPLSPRASPSPCPSSSTRCFSPCSACCSTSPGRRSKASCSTSIARSAEEPPRPSGRCSITPGESWGRSCLRRCWGREIALPPCWRLARSFMCRPRCRSCCGLRSRGTRMRCKSMCRTWNCRHYRRCRVMRKRRKTTRCCSMYSLKCLFGEKKRTEIGHSGVERMGLSISLILTLLILLFWILTRLIAISTIHK